MGSHKRFNIFFSKKIKSLMKVSIITTAYNSADTIKDTIESVLSQTYNDIEYWIIDGNSKDGTVNIIKEYEPLFDGRLHYVSESDKGIYDAMNKGLSKCAGDIVGFLNSDDYFTSVDIIENIVNTFENSNTHLDAVYGDIHFVKPDNPNKIIRYYSSALFNRFWLRFGFMPAHPSFYATREIYEKYGNYSLEYKIASDYEMMVRLFYKNRIKAKYIKKDFVTMRIGGISTKNVKNRLLITKEDVMACKNNGLYTNIFLISIKYLYKIFEFRK